MAVVKSNSELVTKIADDGSLLTRLNDELVDFSDASDILFSYSPGDALSSFTRASKAWQAGDDQLWDEIASGTVRDAHYALNPVSSAYERATLLEAARTNEIKDPRDLTTTNWTEVGTSIAARDATGIKGDANAACTLTDDDGSDYESVLQDNTISNDSATHVASLFFTKDSDETRFPAVDFLLSGGTSQRSVVHLNTSTGATSVETSAGTTSHYVEDWGDRWRLVITVQNNSTGNTTGRVRIYPARGTSIGTGDTSATGSCIVDVVQLELNASFASSPILGGSSATSRSADLLQLDYTVAPQAATYYWRGIWTGPEQNGRVWDIGSGNTDSRILIYREGTNGFRGFYHNGTSSVNTGTLTDPDPGKLLELRLAHYSDGDLLLGMSVDEGAESTTARTAGDLGIANAWSAQKLTLGNRAQADLPTYAGHDRMKVFTGERSLAQCRSLAGVS